MATFTLETAQEIFDSGEPHPVSLDEVYYWLGYTDGDTCAYHISRLSETWDYREFVDDETQEDVIMFSITGFMSLALLVDNAHGWKVREYFIDCEMRARKRRYDEIIAKHPHLADR
jgi:hypothetical protein